MADDKDFMRHSSQLRFNLPGCLSPPISVSHSVALILLLSLLLWPSGWERHNS